MQDDQQADAQIANEPAPTACATPPQKCGRLVTFFAKMYSPHGTLTCKEFVWPAVYLLTLGTIFDGLMAIPLQILALNAPIRDAHFVVKVLVALYATGQHIMLFIYPQFNIYRKLLKNTPLRETYCNCMLGAVCIFIYTHSYFLKGDSLLHRYSGYILGAVLTVVIYIVGKIFCYKRNDATFTESKYLI